MNNPPKPCFQTPEKNPASAVHHARPLAARGARWDVARVWRASDAEIPPVPVEMPGKTAEKNETDVLEFWGLTDPQFPELLVDGCL